MNFQVHVTIASELFWADPRLWGTAVSDITKVSFLFVLSRRMRYVLPNTSTGHRHVLRDVRY